jgi:predicted GTPase
MRREVRTTKKSYAHRFVLDLPSAQLREGITLVDTPGLWSLAASDASQTLAYLPKGNASAVLVDGGSTLMREDLQTVRTLQEAGTNILSVSKRPVSSSALTSNICWSVAR